jgi:hypothetical protein
MILKKILSILIFIILANSQIVIDANPPAVTLYAEETTTIVLDGDLNSINGASCIASFELSSNSPNNFTWVTNIDLSITFSSPSLSEVGFYEIRYEVIETGVGA